MSTPSGVVFVARAADGTETDVTEDVQALYDLMIGSMDWGSGFLTFEDAEHVVRVARLGGFANAEEAQKYIDDKHQAEEEYAFFNAAPVGRKPVARTYEYAGSGKTVITDIPHDHVWSSVGRCMWSNCYEVKSGD